MDRSKDKFFNDIHRLGRILVILVLVAFIFVPIALTIAFDADVNIRLTLVGVGALLSFMVPLAIGEFFGYAPVLGPSMYLSLMTGNTVNMKIPVVVSSLQSSKVDPASKEGEIIKIMAVGASSLTATIIIFISMLAMTTVLPFLESDLLAPAMDNVFICMMGGLMMPMMMADIKRCIFPIALVIVLVLLLGSTTVSSMLSFVIIIVLILTTVFEYILAKKKEKKEAKAQS